MFPLLSRADFMRILNCEKNAVVEMKKLRLILLLGGLTFYSALFCLLVQRRQLTFLAQDSQKLHNQRKIVVLAANVFNLKWKAC